MLQFVANRDEDFVNRGLMKLPSKRLDQSSRKAVCARFDDGRFGVEFLGGRKPSQNQRTAN